MATSQDCFEKYGDPYKYQSQLVLIRIPKELKVGKIPEKIYCNKDMVDPLFDAFSNLINRGFINELKTWDGCFNIRKMRNGNSMSLHSWAIACDLNAADNPQGAKPKLSAGFVKCFTDAGFEWGGHWWNGKSIDGMHFQLKNV